MDNMKTANKFKKYNPTTEQEHWFVDFFSKGKLVRHDWFDSEEQADAEVGNWVEDEVVIAPEHTD